MKKAFLFIVYLIVVTTLLGLLLEGISYLILQKISKSSGGKLKFNRTLSGYTVFQNTPDYTFPSTIKLNPDDKDVTTNNYGLICDEPITEEKGPNTIRIFLLGGSAALGAGQNNLYQQVKKYPQGIYAYNNSIAGCLKKYLALKFPGKKIQVVNAACYQWKLHQAMLFYLETVSHFKPDVVIDMDGYNDVGNIATGYVFEATEIAWLKSYVDLKTETENRTNKLNTVRLLNLLLAKRNDVSKTHNRDYFVDTSVYNQARYEATKPGLELKSTAFLQVLSEYMGALKNDSVSFVFVLQPMLARGINKHLSTTENKMNTALGTADPHVKPYVYNDPRIDINKTDFNVDSMVGVTSLVRRYFFDDWLSDEMRKKVESNGFVYTDMNQDIQNLDSNFEFYTDYCHLTPAGYKLVAERIGDIIIQHNMIKQ